MKKNRARLGASCFLTLVLDATATNQSHPQCLFDKQTFGEKIDRLRHSRIGRI
jgi:hypothetical protein